MQSGFLLQYGQYPHTERNLTKNRELFGWERITRVGTMAFLTQFKEC
jgi:hypothetical protein